MLLQALSCGCGSAAATDAGAKAATERRAVALSQPTRRMRPSRRTRWVEEVTDIVVVPE
jgi:hypothetical protein